MIRKATYNVPKYKGNIMQKPHIIIAIDPDAEKNGLASTSHELPPVHHFSTKHIIMIIKYNHQKQKNMKVDKSRNRQSDSGYAAMMRS